MTASAAILAVLLLGYVPSTARASRVSSAVSWRNWMDLRPENKPNATLTLKSADSMKIVRPDAARIVEEVGTVVDKCWIQHAERMGCKAQCECGILEQCFPKFVYWPGVSTDQNSPERIDVGVCGIAMWALIFISGTLFVAMLSCVVTVRMYFQWCETQVVHEGGFPDPMDTTKATGSVFMGPTVADNVGPPAAEDCRPCRPDF
mmetsp:Transcript_30571/g.59979  ORF Transcript_30571/g.59979 Transcript_30571/m.59979 type:complete len:204 (+) Transcript_30571:76-687(+)